MFRRVQRMPQDPVSVLQRRNHELEVENVQMKECLAGKWSDLEYLERRNKALEENFDQQVELEVEDRLRRAKRMDEDWMGRNMRELKEALEQKRRLEEINHNLRDTIRTDEEYVLTLENKVAELEAKVREYETRWAKELERDVQDRTFEATWEPKMLAYLAEHPDAKVSQLVKDVAGLSQSRNAEYKRLSDLAKRLLALR